MEWQAAKEIGYEPKTTFWQDFTIAEKFGEQAIKETAERAFNEWHTDVKYLAELVLVLNHKCWAWNNIRDDLMQLYSMLYYEYNDKAWDWLEKYGTHGDRDYYFYTLD